MVIAAEAEAVRPAPTETATMVAPEGRPVLREATAVLGMPASAAQAVRAALRTPATVERAETGPSGALRMAPEGAAAAGGLIPPEATAGRRAVMAAEAVPRAILLQRRRMALKASS